MEIREGVFHLRLCHGVGATAVALELDEPCISEKFYMSKVHVSKYNYNSNKISFSKQMVRILLN